MVNTQQAVKASSGVFNYQVFANFGGFIGTYLPDLIPTGIKMSYKVKDIAQQKSDHMVVTISKEGAVDRTLNIFIYVTNQKLDDLNTKDKVTRNATYNETSKTIKIIGDNVGFINYPLSSIEFNGVKWDDIEHIDWGAHPENILSIGDSAFINSKLHELDLSSLTNLTQIENGAFVTATTSTESPITKVNFSGLKNLITIDNQAFGWASLDKLTLTGLKNLVTIGTSAFGLAHFTKLDLSNLKNLTTIGSVAFQQSPLTSLNLSNIPSLTNIGAEAFNGVESKLQLIMSESKYKELIYGGTTQDYRSNIFGGNANSIERKNQ